MKYRYIISMTFFMLSFIFTACQTSDAQDSTQQKKIPTPQIDWSYDGETGAENWASLSDDFTMCAGDAQSPIDIDTSRISLITTNSGLNTSNYTDSEISISNDANVLQFHIKDIRTIQEDFNEYDLSTLLIHLESEHTIDGTRYPMEIQFINYYAEDDMLGIAVLVEKGEENAELAKFIDSIPGKGESESIPLETLSLTSLLPTNLSYYSYSGSETIPPCRENMHWNILKNTIEASEEQIKTFKERLDKKSNYRPLQKKNNRILYSFEER